MPNTSFWFRPFDRSQKKFQSLFPVPRHSKSGQRGILVGLEALEDRTVPTYVPALGWGQSEGFPLQKPGAIDLAFAYGDVNLDGFFYESVLGTDAGNSILAGSDSTHIGHVFNTEGPVITLGGGALQLGANIEFGRAAGFTTDAKRITSGNEILVNSGPGGGGSLTALKGDSLKYLSTNVEAGSQVILGDISAPSDTINTFSNKFQVGGNGIGNAGAIQAQAGLNILQGAFVPQGSGSIVVSAAAGSTLIINGEVGGIRSSSSFSNFVIRGGGNVILDNVFPFATITPKSGAYSGSNSLTFVVDLSEAIQGDLVKENLDVTNGSVTGITKISSTRYEFTVVGNVADGMLGNVEASIAPGIFKDLAYLFNTGSNVAKITVDRDRPTASGTFSDLDKQHILQTSIPIQVFFTDGAGSGIDPATIAASNLLVTTDNGHTLAVSANPTFDSATGKATYFIQSGSTWGDLGASGPVHVTVALVDSSVSDNVGNGALAATLGGFTIDITKEPTQVPPSITSVNSTTFEVGKFGSFTFTATGKPAPSFSIKSGNLPVGLSLNSLTGDLSGIPGVGSTGVYRLNVVASNGVEPADSQIFTISVLKQKNESPSGSDKAISMLEDRKYVFQPGDFGFSDTNVPANNFLSVKITTLPQVGKFSLLGAENPIIAGQFVQVSDIMAGRLVYSPAANVNGVGIANFTFQVRDDGGVVNGGVDLDPTPNTISFDIASINDAPSGKDGVIPILEDSTYAFKVSDFGFTDANDNPSNAFQALRIATLPQKGALGLVGSATPITVGQMILVSDILGSKFVYKPAFFGNGFGYSKFTFQVRDDGGVANGGVDLDPSSNTIKFDVSSVNDAPAGNDKTVSMLEDGGYPLQVSDFGFSDSFDNPANSFVSVKIATLPDRGSLVMAGQIAPVSVGQFISVSELSAGRLAYRPSANESGSGYSKFSFQVRDGGGVANGGVDLDPSPNTITFNVSPVNDSPSGANKTITLFEDGAYSFKLSDFGFSDSNDNPANGLLAVKISSLPQNGKLSLTGFPVPLISGQFIMAGDIGKLVFTPAPNASGAGYSNFRFQVRDNGGVANGGIDLDPSANTIRFDVTPVNDAPTLAVPPSFNFLEDVSGNLVFSGTPFADLDSRVLTVTLAVPLGAVSAMSMPLISVGGTATSRTITGALIDLNAYFTKPGNITYVGAPNLFGSVLLATTVSDGSLFATANSLIQVASVNDAPAGADNAFSILEDKAYSFKAADFGFTDPNDSPANNLLGVRITTLPLNGKLTLQGSIFPINVGQVILASDISRLVFTPSANSSGSGYASFKFQVKDSGGVANGGIDLDPSAQTISFHVTSVNDAPSGTNKTITMARSTTFVFGLASFGFVDASDSPPNELSRVLITTRPAAGKGSLFLNGVLVNAGTFVTASDIKAGKLKYTPPVGATGNPFSTFTFQVEDDGGTANGGVNLDPVAKSFNFRIS